MSAGAALDAAFRAEWAGVVAALARRLRDLDLAEDAAADALADAARAWPRDGVPANPGAWLMVAARRRALDRLRRDRRHAERVGALADLAGLAAHVDDPEPAIPDDRLELLFACCHPALAPEARIALTLRAVAGLSTGEIARAFLVAEPAMAQRLVRAKHKIAAARIPFRVPDAAELPARVGEVLRVVYLVFNEGWAASAGDALVRRELCVEAIRLARLLRVLLPGDREVTGLLALLVLLDARRAARTDAQGAFVPLDAQDRARWDSEAIAEAIPLAEEAVAGGAGPYGLQAAIAALHAAAPAPEATDWPQIAALYAELHRREPSPVVGVNRAVALAFAGRLADGRALLDALRGDPRLGRYQPLHAADAELCRRAGDAPGARAAYERAIALSTNAVERAELHRRLRAL